MDTKPRNEEAVRVVAALGGTYAVAKIFGIRPPSVSEWMANGIPEARRMYLKLAHPKAFEPSDDESQSAAA